MIVDDESWFIGSQHAARHRLCGLWRHTSTTYRGEMQSMLFKRMDTATRKPKIDFMVGVRPVVCARTAHSKGLGGAK